MGYGNGSPIPHVDSIADARKVKIGTKSHYGGLITHITFYNADGEKIAGGETKEEDWKPDKFEELELKEN